MSPLTIQTVTISLLVISTITSWGLCWIIASYLRQKPQNYQTLVDHFALDFLFHFIVFNTNMNLVICLMRSEYQFDKTFALFIQAISTLSVYALLIWFIIIIFVKYITIFHPSLVADSDYTDEEILVKARFYTGGITIVLFIIEFCFFQNFWCAFIFLMLSGIEQDKLQRFRLKNVHLLALATITSIIYVNFKINKSGYKERNSKKWLQKVIAVVCIILIAATFPVAKSSGRSQIIKSYISVLFSWTSTLLPAFFIATYDNLRHYLLKRFSLFVPK